MVTSKAGLLLRRGAKEKERERKAEQRREEEREERKGAEKKGGSFARRLLRLQQQGRAQAAKRRKPNTRSGNLAKTAYVARALLETLGGAATGFIWSKALIEVPKLRYQNTPINRQESSGVLAFFSSCTSVSFTDMLQVVAVCKASC